MLGVDTVTSSGKASCPFQADTGRCGAPTRVVDPHANLAKCNRGHVSHVESLSAPPSEPSPFLSLRVLRLPRVRTVVLTALVVDAVANHL